MQIGTEQLRTVLPPLMLATGLGLGLASCSDSTGPAGALSFSQAALVLQSDLSGTVSIRNGSERAYGPIQLRGGPVTDAADASIPGARLAVTPDEIPTLAPGTQVAVDVSVIAGALLQAGSYRSELVAAVGGEERRLPVSFTAPEPAAGALSSLVIAGDANVRQGDVVAFSASGTDAAGGAVNNPLVTWTVHPVGAGFMSPAGQLVAYTTGSVTVRATSGVLMAETAVTVSARGVTGGVSRVGEGAVSDRHTSDLWVHGQHAYTGTWGQRTEGGVPRFGDELNVWDVSNPASPTRTRTLAFDARTVNDVKVRADGELAVITHEGSNDGLNGVTFLGLTDPADPEVLGRFTSGLESGIHNAWLDGNYAYLVLDGTGNGLRILDVSDPANPNTVAAFWAGSSFLHDVYVRDGLAFLSHWGAGLIILDVGNGVRGGSPTAPVEVSRISDLDGQTHNAWYWPEAGYVFVGEEDFSTPGIMHVVDVRDLTAPVEVATFRVGGTTPHNFWLDEDAGVLFLAWYQNGVRALDVNGPLLGDLDRQGREVFTSIYDGAGFGCASVEGTCSWAPQLHDGLLYVSDMNKGLVVLQPSY